MSASSSVGDFDLNFVKLRKPLEFADGTIQDTAYTGDGNETLAEVLAVGNNASGQSILGVGALAAQTGSFVVASGASAGATLFVEDSVSGNEILFTPCSTAGSSNPLVAANDAVIKAVAGANSLTITSDSATNSGVRITDNSITMGAGGALATPAFYFQSVGNDKNYIKGNCAMEGTLDLATNDITNVDNIQLNTINGSAYPPANSITLITNNTTITPTAITNPSINPNTNFVINSFGLLPAGMYSLSIYWDLQNNQANTIVFNNVIIEAQLSGVSNYPRNFFPDISLASGADSLESNSVFQFSTDGTQSLTLRYSSNVASGIYDSSGAQVIFTVSYFNLIRLTSNITP